MEIRAFSVEDTDAVVALWQETGLVRPWNDPYEDIARKLRVQPQLFLVGVREGRLVATAMGGYDGHRGTLYYFAVVPEVQGRGYGRALLHHLEAKLRGLGCPKLNLLVRGDNVMAERFYERRGYALQEVRCFGKKLDTC